VTLLLALAILQDPNSRLGELLAQFQDDSIEVREKAGREMVALGEPALPALKNALDGETNAEVRARIRDVVVRIEAEKRRREFKGGTPVNGLAASLEGTLNPEKTEFRLKVQFMNVGTQPVEFALITGWNRRLPNFSSSSSGAEACVTIRQLTGERGNRFGGRFGCGGRPVYTFVRLAPGEGRTYEHAVDVTELRAGDHEIEVEYLATKLLKDFTENPKSNVLPFKIER
jgi:hypothetical protein